MIPREQHLALRVPWVGFRQRNHRLHHGKSCAQADQRIKLVKADRDNARRRVRALEVQRDGLYGVVAEYEVRLWGVRSAETVGSLDVPTGLSTLSDVQEARDAGVSGFWHSVFRDVLLRPWSHALHHGMSCAQADQTFEQSKAQRDKARGRARELELQRDGLYRVVAEYEVRLRGVPSAHTVGSLILQTGPSTLPAVQDACDAEERS